MAYRVSGPRILHNNQEIQFHGVNVCGAELNDATISGLWSGQSIAEMITRIKAQGFNGVRIPIGPKCLQNVKVDEGLTGAGWYPASSFLKGKKSLEIMDYWVAEFEKQGIRIIWDWHYLENGKIPDLWYTGSYSEQQWLNDLKTLAGRYRGQGILGIDIKNEPNSNSATWGDGSNRDWKLAAEKAFQAINSANQDILIIVEWTGTQTGINQMVQRPLNIPADRLVLSVHIYFSDVWGQYVKYFDDPAYPSNLPGIWDQMFGAFSQNNCIYVGEWGGQFGRSKPKDKTDQEAFVAYLRAKGIINHSYWQWGANSGDTGGVLSDGTWKNLRQDKMQMIYTIKTGKATYLGEGSISQPDPVVVTPTPAPTPTPTPIPSNPASPATPVNVTFPSSMRIDNFPSVQKVSLDRDFVVQLPEGMSVKNFPPVQRVEVTNPTQVQMPSAIGINNFPAVQRVEVTNPSSGGGTMPSEIRVNNFPITQRVIVDNPTESSLPENINVNLAGQAPQIANFNWPETMKVLLEGAASGGGGGSFNFPNEITIKEALTLAFPATLPQLTVNFRNVAPVAVAPSANPKAFALGSLVYMLAAPTIKLVVERYEGDLAVCKFSNDVSGEFSSANFPDGLLRAWVGA